MFVLNFWAVSSVPGASVQFSLSVLAFWRIGVLVCVRVQFFGSLFGPRCLCSIFATVGGRRSGPWCGASIGTTCSAPCTTACRPWSMVRGLCWNHVFRPLSPYQRTTGSGSGQTAPMGIHDCPPLIFSVGILVTKICQFQYSPTLVHFHFY